jgi:integrase
MEELKKILKVANEEWQGMVLVGLYTGLRLGDIANLTWANIDMQNQQLTVATRKTGRSQNLPIAKPLLRHLESLLT